MALKGSKPANKTSWPAHHYRILSPRQNPPLCLIPELALACPFTHFTHLSAPLAPHNRNMKAKGVRAILYVACWPHAMLAG